MDPLPVPPPDVLLGQWWVAANLRRGAVAATATMLRVAVAARLHLLFALHTSGGAPSFPMTEAVAVAGVALLGGGGDDVVAGRFATRNLADPGGCPVAAAAAAAAAAAVVAAVRAGGVGAGGRVAKVLWVLEAAAGDP